MVIVLLLAAFACAAIGGLLGSALAGLTGAVACAVAGASLGTLAVSFALAASRGRGDDRPRGNAPGANSEPELLAAP